MVYEPKGFYEKSFYHIYPLGMCGAPHQNDFQEQETHRLTIIQNWIPHLKRLGISDVYLGPLFESESHGYDTVDYRKVDRRLGTNEDLKNLVRAFHKSGIKVTLDTVFNHTGREFFAFRDIRKNRENSQFRDWYTGLSFAPGGINNEGIHYEGWAGHLSLVKLNLGNSEVKKHLFNTLEFWIQEFDIDGLRLDAADVMDKNFLSELTRFGSSLKKDFFVFGEVVHGDYTEWCNPNTLHSVTNYEAYKGLWSSHRDKNLFEIAWTLKRQFGNNGIYRGLPLYNFADNHDVTRLRSNLDEQAHLYTVYGLLFTMPGIPSIYYGSEFGLEGQKAQDDWPLRPTLQIETIQHQNPDLQESIAQFNQIRQHSPALKYGDYQELHVASEQLLFQRSHPDQTLLVALNISNQSIKTDIPDGNYRDLLTNKTVSGNKTMLHPHWLQILEKV